MLIGYGDKKIHKMSESGWGEETKWVDLAESAVGDSEPVGPSCYVMDVGRLEELGCVVLSPTVAVRPVVCRWEYMRRPCAAKSGFITAAESRYFPTLYAALKFELDARLGEAVKSGSITGKTMFDIIGDAYQEMKVFLERFGSSWETHKTNSVTPRKRTKLTRPKTKTAKKLKRPKN